MASGIRSVATEFTLLKYISDLYIWGLVGVRITYVRVTVATVEGRMSVASTVITVVV